MNGLLFIINTAGRLELHTEEELPSIVVERCANYLKTGKILSGTYEIKATGEKKFTSTVDFILKKDNLVTLDGKSSQEIFDGKWHFVANKLEKTYEIELPENAELDLRLRTTRTWLRPAPMPLHDAAIWLEISPTP